MAGAVGPRLPAGAIRKPARTTAAAAPGLGGGKEALIVSAGALVVYVLCVAFRRPFCRYFRRLYRYVRTKAGWTGNDGPRAQQNNLHKNLHKNYGKTVPGHG